MSVRDQVINKAQAVVPMERQIQGMHLYQRAKQLVIGDRQPRFDEYDIPDVSKLDADPDRRQ